MGRPMKQIDKVQFEKLCALQCTEEEICGFLDVTDKTLEKWCQKEYKAHFSEVFRQKRGVGKVSLRRSQWRLAEKNANMAIWLGKQYLGQRDMPQENTTETQNNDMQTLADLLQHPVPNRDIKDFET